MSATERAPRRRSSLAAAATSACGVGTRIIEEEYAETSTAEAASEAQPGAQVAIALVRKHDARLALPERRPLDRKRIGDTNVDRLCVGAEPQAGDDEPRGTQLRVSLPAASNQEQ
jgi:hypothetical protein